jgi:hypothetical protein
MKEGGVMTADSKQYSRAATELAEQLIALAEEATLECERSSSIMLYGIIRECGYRIKAAVEGENGSLENCSIDEEKREVDRRLGSRRKVNPYVYPPIT